MNAIPAGTDIAPGNSSASSIVETALRQQHAVQQHAPFQANATKGSLGGSHGEQPSPGSRATFLTAVELGGETQIQGKSAPTGQADSRNIIAEIIMTMDLPGINFIRNEIRKHNDALGCIDFVLTMATCAVGDTSKPFASVDGLDLQTVADFCELFSEIDVNSDGTVDWEEMSSFLVEMGMKGWDESGVGMPAYAYAGQLDGVQPTHAADQIEYFSDNDTVAVLEPNASFFRVYHAESMQLRRQYDIKNAGGCARALCFCKATGHYVLGTSASRMCFYDEGCGTAWRTFSTPSTPICLTYVDSHDLLVAGDTIGNIFSWNIEHIKQTTTDDGAVPSHSAFGAPFKTKMPTWDPEKDGLLSADGGHTDAVLNVRGLADTGVLASCSMDRTVKLWDLATMGLKNTLLGHPKGVRHLAYCPDHRLIVSGGFCYDLVISNPYVSSPISRLRGHSSPIVGVEHLLGTSQLITADADGACKLWDLRTFACVETFTFGAAEANKTRSRKNRNSSCSAATREPLLACMTVTPPYKRVLVGGRTVDSFEVLRDECEDLTDDTVVLAVCFNDSNLTFVTASAWAVKVWDGDTGELLCADARQSPPGREDIKSELTSMCLGTRGRKVILGDGIGRIKVLNHLNHVELKNYSYSECTGKAHEGDVRTLIFIEEHTLLLSASGDGSISIHDESQRDSGALLRRITNATWSEIAAVKYSAHFGLIASGSTDGSIQLWNFELGRHEGCCFERHQHPVTCLLFLEPFPLLLSADMAGNLALWALPPARAELRFRRIFTWINKQPISSRTYGGGGGVDGRIPVAVTAMESQVEMIATSVASTVTSSSLVSSGGDIVMMMAADGSEEDSLQLSGDKEGGGEDEESDTRPGGSGGGAKGGGRVDDPGGVSVDKAQKIETGGESRGESGDGDKNGDACGTPGPGAVEGVDASGEGGRGLEAEEGGSSSSLEGSGDSPTDPSGGTSTDHSFQERLAAILRKYKGDRQRYCQEEGTGQSEARAHRVHWNQKMLAYTLYAADDAGRVTTWDLKPLLLSLVRIHGGHDWVGHGVGVIRSPVKYSNVFRTTRYDAKGVLFEHRHRLHVKAAVEWSPDVDTLGLHRIGSWEAHTEPILTMNLVERPPTVITAAMDRLVKLWSPSGDLRGVLRPKQNPETPWVFRVDRRVRDDRKARAAEEVILAAESSNGNGGRRPPANGTRATCTTTARGNSSKGGGLPESDDATAGEALELSSYDENLLDGKPRHPRRYAEEELDRYGESESSKASLLRMPLLLGATDNEDGGSCRASGRGVRKTPRRVPIRPKNSGRAGVRRSGWGSSSGSSPRTSLGQLVSPALVLKSA